MGKRISIKHKRKTAPEWVFNWRPRRIPAFSKAAALLLVTGLFAGFMTSVRIRMAPPTPWAARKASVIQVSDDADGLALALRAREGGPFPSRLEPSAWDGVAAMERQVFEAVRYQPPPYTPNLRSLLNETDPFEHLAAKGEATLPMNKPKPGTVPPPEKLILKPVIYPLSGFSSALMPDGFPPFDGSVDAAMAAESWRFLIRLDPAGNVRDCVSLAGGVEGGPSPLAAWLHRIPFKPEPSKPARWIAVGVDFINQRAHGTDTR